MIFVLTHDHFPSKRHSPASLAVKRAVVSINECRSRDTSTYSAVSLTNALIGKILLPVLCLIAKREGKKFIFITPGSLITFVVEVNVNRRRRNMHRCRAMYHGAHESYPYLPLRQHQHAFHTCSSCEIPEPMPDVHCCTSPYAYEYPYRRPVPYMDCSCYNYLPYVPPRPPIVQTNIQNEICYHLDEPEEIYDDGYGNPYRMSRSKVQLVDLAPRQRPRARQNPHGMVVSTFQPREHEAPERVMMPRSTVLRHTSLPSYERPRRMKLMPLYRSAEPQHMASHRHRHGVPEMIPVATMANPRARQQTIRVRSLSPLV